MDTYRKDRPDTSDQIKQLQKIPWSVDENQELENKYLLVHSELDLLKKSIKNLKHDLRNPLFAIIGIVDVMIIEDKDQIEVQTCDLIMIKESAESLLNLLNGALVIRDTQKNLKESVNINRNLSSVITEINRLYLLMAQNKGISLSLRSQIDTEIQLSPNFFIKLIQITGNLVANAVKFTPSNGSVDVVFNLDVVDNHSILNMTVADTGKSMSPDQISAFNQGKPVPRSMGTNGEQGLGIGLQHVIQMVSEYAGRILVKSEKGLGTEFSLSFPLPDKYLNRKNGLHSIVKNGTVLHNGSQS